VADRKRNPWIALLWKVLFRIAFGGYIILQFVVFVLLLWVLSKVFPEPNAFVAGVLVVLILASPFAIGATSYLVFKRMTHAEYVLAESERWLTERHRYDTRQIERRNRVRRAVLWIPASSVFLFCLFLDYTWPPLTHLFHAGYGRLGNYEVSLPLDWSITYSDSEPKGSKRRSYARAEHWNNMLRSGIDEFMGKRPSLTSSSLGCYSSRPDEEFSFSPSPDRDRLVATRQLSHDNVFLTCEEFVSQDPWRAAESHRISCVTAEQDFDCSLYGGDARDVKEFYDMVKHIKKLK